MGKLDESNIRLQRTRVKMLTRPRQCVAYRILVIQYFAFNYNNKGYTFRTNYRQSRLNSFGPRWADRALYRDVKGVEGLWK